jgi:hypothetical protein
MREVCDMHFANLIFFNEYDIVLKGIAGIEGAVS